MRPSMITKSVALFMVAGLLEIGGGYLVWLWLPERRAHLLGALGGLVLFLYGVVPTMQPAHFGRAYGAYGGILVLLSRRDVVYDPTCLRRRPDHRQRHYATLTGTFSADPRHACAASRKAPAEAVNTE